MKKKRRRILRKKRIDLSNFKLDFNNIVLVAERNTGIKTGINK